MLVSGFQVPHVGIVLTDGESNKDEHLVQHEADRARSTGTNLIALGISQGVNFPELQMIADTPDYLNVLYVNTFDELMNIRDTLVNRICTFGKHSTFSHYLFSLVITLKIESMKFSNLGDNFIIYVS